VRVAQLLKGLGAKVRAADPHVVEAGVVDALVERVELTRQEIEAADAVLLLTEHDAFDVAEVTAHAQFLLDCRRVAPAGPNVETL
jgi:UDP-N-acetyl-D-glucosamine dehydrogenase